MDESGARSGAQGARYGGGSDWCGDCASGRNYRCGFNQTISHCDPTAHAEIVAIRAAANHVGNHRLAGADMYVTIEPCTMCAGALVQARIARLIFAAAEPRAGAVTSSARVLENPGLNHRVEIESGLCQAEAAELMAGFFRVRR